MTDIDLIANLDPATGLPLVDTRSAARRWLEALAYGSEHHDVTKAFHIKKISAKSGPEKQHQQSRRRRPQKPRPYYGHGTPNILRSSSQH